MAQSFRRAAAFDSAGDVAIGTSAVSVLTGAADTSLPYDAIIGIRLANITTNIIKADIWIASTTASGGAADSYLAKDVPIPAGSSLELIDGGSKVVMAAGDVLKVKADTASSLNCWVSYIKGISS